MAFSDEQLTTMRQELGLPENADEATIVSALSEALQERAETPTAPTAGRPPAGMALVEQTVLDELRAHAQEGRQARQQQLTEARDRAIDAAIADGRTTPARREHWQRAWDADADGTRQVLDSLEKGLVPLEEKGTATEPAASADDGWFSGYATAVTTSQED